MSNHSIAVLSFALCAVILINNVVALILNTEISRMTVSISVLLMIILLINGIVHKKRARK